MTTHLIDFLAEQKRLAEDAQADSTSLYAHPTGEWTVKSSKRTIVALDGLIEAVPRMIAALEAVMALHRKNLPEDGDCQGFGAMPGEYGYLDDWCVECSEQSGREYGMDWPCATYRAIEAALGGEGND